MCTIGPLPLINLFKIDNFKAYFINAVQPHLDARTQNQVKVILNKVQLHISLPKTVQPLMVSQNVSYNKL